jgi:hypothetical protein
MMPFEWAQIYDSRDCFEITDEQFYDFTLAGKRLDNKLGEPKQLKLILPSKKDVKPEPKLPPVPPTVHRKLLLKC